MSWGVPTASIVKAADRMNVPRPASGHWQLVARGWTIEREPLPPPGESTPAFVILGPPQKTKPILPESKPAEAKPAVSVADDLRQLHPQVQALHAIMKSAPVIERGPVEVAEDGNFNVWLSRQQMRRGLLILDALVKGMEAGGAIFRTGSKFNKHLVAKFPDGMVEFRIYEQMKHEWVKIGSVPVGAGFMANHEWRYTPSGKLSFSITDHWPQGTRKNWHDGVRQRLEDKVGEIVAQLCANPGLAKKQRDEWESECAERNRLRHEEYLRWSAPERLTEMKAALKKQIEDHERAWEKARSVREFLALCEHAMKAGEGGTIQEWQSRWLGWGRAWVDGIDPLTNGFLTKLKMQFEELEELEAFVVQLREEKAARKTGS